ncbi:ABC transporter substrate-binding protein [Undibacterium sp. TJN25]|uniref:ABC transporter substrate-binding protein n=1 Tax=Undibacterium sp. TJN25 TaxID=3413056 RepID=UPI003BF33B48
MKHIRRLIASSVMAASAIAPAHAAEKVVVYQAFQSIQYLPLYVALDQGIFAKHGLDVQKVTAGSGAQGVAAVIGGHADFSLQDPMTAVMANLKGASLLNVATIVAGAPVWMVAPENSPIKSIDDLKDQTIAVALPPSTSTYMLQRLLKDKGLSNVKLNTVQIGTELSPVSAGRAAAAVLYQPQVDQALASGYKIVHEFGKQYSGQYAFSTIDTLKSTIKNKPKMVQSFVAAIGEAEALMRASPETAIRIGQKEFPTLNETVVSNAVKRMISQNVYPPNPAISRLSFQNNLDLHLYIGNVKPGEVTYESAVDNSFAEKLNR